MILTQALTQANHQWATRPADERFWSVADAKLARAQSRARSFDIDRALDDLRVEAIDGDVQIVSRKASSTARFFWRVIGLPLLNAVDW